jgi:hypothetical protein
MKNITPLNEEFKSKMHWNFPSTRNFYLIKKMPCFLTFFIAFRFLIYFTLRFSNFQMNFWSDHMFGDIPILSI